MKGPPLLRFLIRQWPFLPQGPLRALPKILLAAQLVIKTQVPRKTLKADPKFDICFAGSLNLVVVLNKIDGLNNFGGLAKQRQGIRKGYQ